MKSNLQSPNARSRRRWWRWTFSLRTMFLAVTLVAVGLVIDEHWDQPRRAIAAIESRGGLVGYNIRVKASPPVAWLRERLPWCYFYEVRIVDLSKTPVGDDDLVHLWKFKSLQYLSLKETNISDAGLVHLAKSKSLRLLFLDATLVTDDGLTQLDHLTSLEVLNVYNTQVTPAGIKRLKAVHPRCEVGANCSTSR